MKKKVLAIFFILSSLLVLSSGCGLLNQRSITLKLGGFPYIAIDYKMTILAYQGNELLNKIEYKDLDPNSNIIKKVNIKKDADILGIFLYDTRVSSTKPVYFVAFKITPGNSTYGNYYWLDYAKYSATKVIDYGISQAFAQNIGLNSSVELDFNKAPYYIFKLSNVKNKDVEVSFPDDHIGIYYSTTFPENQFTTGDDEKLIVPNCAGEELYICLKQRIYNNQEPPKGTLTISECNADNVGGMAQLIPTADPEMVLGYDKEQSSIHLINPKLKRIEKTLTSPIHQPSMVEYSPIDREVYAMSGFQCGLFGVLNVDTGEQRTFTLDFIDSSFHIQPATRKLFVFGRESNQNQNMLKVFNMDTHELLADNPINDNFVVFNDSKNQVYGINHVNYPSITVNRYTIKNDILTLEQSISPESAFPFIITPDGSKLAVTYYNRNIFSYVLKVFNAMNLEEVLSEVALPMQPDTFAFSPDGSKLYLMHSVLALDDIYAFDMTSYTLIGKVATVNLHAGPELAVNADGSTLLCANGQILAYYDLTPTVNNIDSGAFNKISPADLEQIFQFINTGIEF